MFDSCDIQTGSAVAMAGLLALGGWIWLDATERGHKVAAALWLAITWVSLGVGAIAYLVHTRKMSGSLLRGVVVWAVWMALIGSLSYATAYQSARSREESRLLPEKTATSGGPQAPGPDRGDFDKVFPELPEAPPNDIHSSRQ